jgi:predicted Rossmann fold flavoprotein
MIYDVAVVGAGACGLTAAIHLNSEKVILFDNKAGALKLSITGNNRCNITNCLNFDRFIENYKPNGNFLRDAFGKFFTKDLRIFLRTLRIETTCVGNRLILKNKKSKELAEILLQKAKESADFRANESVLKIVKDNGIFILTTKSSKYFAKNVLLACGGMSFPKTGSNGYCYKIAEELGHSIVKQEPFEVPFCAKNTKPLQGLSFKNIELTLKIGKKKIQPRGDIIFTHFGISGPAILKLSENEFEITKLFVRFISEDEELFKIRMLSYNGKVKSFLKSYLPERLIMYLTDIDKFTKELSKKEIKSIIDVLFRFEIDVKKCSFDRAFVTKGGISLKEIDPKTMESKIVKNLFFCGEIMDIQGSIGGFNLQAAFSTGFLASSSINRKNRIK